MKQFALRSRLALFGFCIFLASSAGTRLATAAAPDKDNDPKTQAAGQLKLLPGFKAEMVYKVPRDKHGELEKNNDTFTSTVHGWESSNPTTPFILTKQQIERSVQFIFPANMSSLSFT